MRRSVVSLPQQAFTSIDEWLRHLQTTVEAAPAEEDVAPEDVCNRSLSISLSDWNPFSLCVLLPAFMVYMFENCRLLSHKSRRS
jgi:hypothetical protein